MIKKFLKTLWGWETALLAGILSLFVVGGWFAFYNDDDGDLTMKFCMGLVGVVGTFFLVGSFFSWRKKQRIAKQQNEELEKRKLNQG